MRSDYDIEKGMEDFRKLSKIYAEAESQRQYLEDFKKSKIALLMKDAEQEGHKTSAAQEREALASEQYRGILDGLREATKVAIDARFRLKNYEIHANLWQTKSANIRAEKKGYGA